MKTITFKQAACGTAMLLTSFLCAQEPVKGFGKEIQRNGNEFTPCAATEYLKYQQSGNAGRASDKNFEKWLAPKIEAVKKQKMAKTTANIVTLPIVVHVIHNGDEVGVSENISDERIFSQIEVLNNDYRRVQGTPGYDENTPGVDTEIQFCLAQRDPEGNATTGIDRIQLAKASWDWTAIETQLKPETIWDPEKYINIWICNFGGDLANVGGFAFFPEGAGLEGLEGAESNADNDGLAIYYMAFGSSDTFPEGEYFEGRDKGRSVTHEMGHFLGLRHIWGDENNCTADDYCADTPIAFTMNGTCTPLDSCPDDEGNDMIENHMDYTPDACKSVFTNDQKTRMWAVLQNAERRTTLLTSNACSAPTAGMNENKLQGINIHPNPAANVLYISSDLAGVGSYEIYNTLGQLVASDTITFEDGTGIDTSAFSQGIYNIKITHETKTKTLRFIKK